MSTPKPLLAATDLSAHARHAADRAARLARQRGAELTLLHVPPAHALADLREWLGKGMEQQMQQQAQQQLQKLADDLQSAHGGTVHARLVRGNVLDEVARAADELDVALLVLGARGAGVLRHLVLGSTAERLLRRTTRPVLIVRTEAQQRYRRALLAIDFSPFSAEVLAQAQQTAPGARWLLVHAFRVPYEEKLRFAGVDAAVIDSYRLQARAQATQQLHALAKAGGLSAGSWDACILEGDPSLRLVEQEQALGGDLVVLGKHGHSAVEDLLLGSVTKHVLAEGKADVLVVTLPGEG
ncbi:universal stress protein [Piscinibacter sakaiensis]|uniref:universal stress protein n=1 Tax=Piscinibacter sakaiensis TaxID=1547922 RepID=UPI003AAF1365